MEMKVFLRVRAFLASVLFAFALVGCGGGSGGGGGGGAAISGTAAVGAPIDGVVYLTDRNGVETNVPVEADGSFTISVAGMKAPFILRVVPNGGGDTLYSYASSTDIIVNITPLTHLSTFLAYNQGNLAALYDSWDSNNTELTERSLRNAQAIINANLSAELEAAGLDPTLYDFLHGEFAADGTGIDGVLDGLSIAVDLNLGSFTVSDAGQVLLAFDVNVDTSAIQIPSLNGLLVTSDSTWEMTITDTANQIPATSIMVTGLQVPADATEFESFSEADLSGTVSTPELTISYNFTSLTYTFTGSGEVGTEISAQIRGSVSVSGVVEGNVIDETVNVDMQFVWERIQ